MGWAHGSSLLDDVWKTIRPLVPEHDRAQAAKALIELFEDEDCDTIDEAEDVCAAAGREWCENCDDVYYGKKCPRAECGKKTRKRT